MRHRLALGVPVAAAALAIFASGCETPVTSLFELSGEVTDERTLAPIAGARVVFTSDTGFTTETVTGDNGVYRIGVESDSAFGQVYADAAGYVPKQATVYFDSVDRRIDLQLRPM